MPRIMEQPASHGDIVDDNLANLKSLEDILRGRGMKCGCSHRAG